MHLALLLRKKKGKKRGNFLVPLVGSLTKGTTLSNSRRHTIPSQLLDQPSTCNVGWWSCHLAESRSYQSWCGCLSLLLRGKAKIITSSWRKFPHGKNSRIHWCKWRNLHRLLLDFYHIFLTKCTENLHSLSIACRSSTATSLVPLTLEIIKQRKKMEMFWSNTHPN